jgi:metallo-beta-lactamase family protein
MKITFLGANGTVTGSKYLVEVENKKFLVDCGMFQGLKKLRLRNWEKFPVSPRSIDAVLLTHAHIDHSGYLPVLVKNGFEGKVFATQATKELCSILLPDSGYLQEDEARRANKYGYSKHKPAKPLYTKKDALNSLEYFQAVELGHSYRLFDELSFHLSGAGHILGSSFINLTQDKTSIVFSGDIGRPHDPIMKPPAHIQSADYLVMESTYGDRLHEEADPMQQIEEIVNRTIKRGGSVIIPAFAVGRAQMLLYYIYKLKEAEKIPDVPVYLDSPLAIKATNIFNAHSAEHRLTKEITQEVCNVAKYTRTPEESKQIDLDSRPKIVISASGMATGGRILYHLKVFATDPRNTILFVGYQAVGTRGDRMIRGEKEIKIHGEYFQVKAEVEDLHNMSAHADYAEILDWLQNFKNAPRKVFITHGETEAAKSLKEKIEAKFGWDCCIPEYLQTEIL